MKSLLTWWRRRQAQAEETAILRAQIASLQAEVDHYTKAMQEAQQGWQNEISKNREAPCSKS